MFVLHYVYNIVYGVEYCTMWIVLIGDWWVWSRKLSLVGSFPAKMQFNQTQVQQYDDGEGGNEDDEKMN